MKKKEMITYSGEELMQMELPPVRFVVKDFLSQGLNILAGQAKVGKSWMMLDLCIKVAKGEKFFGFDTEKSTVLYLCLEDSPNRIRDRMVKLTDTVIADIEADRLPVPTSMSASVKEVLGFSLLGDLLMAAMENYRFNMTTGGYYQINRDELGKQCTLAFG